MKNIKLILPLCFFNSLVLYQNNSFAEELTLEKSMNIAENYAFSARLSEQDVEISEGRKAEQWRSMLPNISLSGNHLKYNDSVNKLVGTSTGSSYGVPGTTVSSAGFTLTQPLVGLLPLYLSLQQASAATKAAIHSKNFAKENARYLGANSFINAVKAKQLFAVAESNVNVATTQLRDANAQFNAGNLTNADILKFKLNLENAQTNLSHAETTYKVTLVTLSETLGIKDPNAVTLPNNYNSVWENKKGDFEKIDIYIDKALSTRHDLLAVKSGVESAKYQKYVTESSYLPSVNFIANYSRNFEAKDINIPTTPYTQAANYSKSDIQDTLYYGFQFSWNILDWGVRQARISEAVAGESSANIQEEQAVSQIKIDVTNSYLKLQEAYQNLDSAKVSVEYAKDVFSQMEAQFNNGQATTTDVLSASDDKTSAEAKLATAIGDLDLAYLTLQKSTGDRLSTLTN